MTEDRFWHFVETSRSETAKNPSSQPEVLQAKLEKLPPAEIISFARIFQNQLNAGFTWDLWAAAYLIEGGCSDDGFEYFRAGLIGLGRQVYTNAVRDPGTLISQPAKGVDFSNEGMLYSASLAYDVVAGEELPDLDVDYPEEPSGEKFDDKKVAEKYPELAKKFGFT